MLAGLKQPQKTWLCLQHAAEGNGVELASPGENPLLLFFKHSQLAYCPVDYPPLFDAGRTKASLAVATILNLLFHKQDLDHVVIDSVATSAAGELMMQIVSGCLPFMEIYQFDNNIFNVAHARKDSVNLLMEATQALATFFENDVLAYFLDRPSTSLDPASNHTVDTDGGRVVIVSGVAYVWVKSLLHSFPSRTNQSLLDVMRATLVGNNNESRKRHYDALTAYFETRYFPQRPEEVREARARVEAQYEGTVVIQITKLLAGQHADAIMREGKTIISVTKNAIEDRYWLENKSLQAASLVANSKFRDIAVESVYLASADPGFSFTGSLGDCRWPINFVTGEKREIQVNLPTVHALMAHSMVSLVNGVTGDWNIGTRPITKYGLQPGIHRAMIMLGSLCFLPFGAEPDEIDAEIPIVEGLSREKRLQFFEGCFGVDSHTAKLWTDSSENGVDINVFRAKSRETACLCTEVVVVPDVCCPADKSWKTPATFLVTCWQPRGKCSLHAQPQPGMYPTSLIPDGRFGSPTGKARKRATTMVASILMNEVVGLSPSRLAELFSVRIAEFGLKIAIESSLFPHTGLIRWLWSIDKCNDVNLSRMIINGNDGSYNQVISRLLFRNGSVTPEERARELNVKRLLGEDMQHLDAIYLEDFQTYCLNGRVAQRNPTRRTLTFEELINNNSSDESEPADDDLIANADGMLALQLQAEETTSGYAELPQVRSSDSDDDHLV